ncbi:hypothetical protein MGYG_00396 [Nannizzia gypsea CBS 118893]|uniref:Uncharacterized protein n=1 Tax=Arthroderma gypseum (strain ATCC MYA-4604 / CBS 118893) TaxID=535722 RepID=E5QZJ1_ARTGP|nr:hypothetical protein MGYG_00396 [Nannizzia gypsea CBS 118893]EFQ97357.1 hypothetical protein MGYG_00396 [Nannizzia gypsea CBS 118893]
MSDYPTSDTPVKRAGLREICEVNGRHFRRKLGTQQWLEYQPDNTPSPASQSQSQPLDLSLVHHRQGEGEPLHWALLVARENQPGMVYQVKGDAEYMTYTPSDLPIDITISESFLTMYHLAVVTTEQAAVVKEVAENEIPPQAPNRQSVTENCQGWTVRVVARLVEKGVVSNAKLQMAESMMQPV